MVDYRFSFMIREGQESDYPFIYNSFLKSYRASPVNKHIGDKVFFSKVHDQMEDYLGSPDIKVFIACPPEDQNTIYGYIVGTPEELMYVYVKQTRRRLTVATKLAQKLFGKEPKGSISYYYPTPIGLKWTKALEEDIFPGLRFIQGF